MHLFITDIGVKGASIPVEAFSRYMARAIDLTVASSQIDAFVYAKFARFALFGEVTPFEQNAFAGTGVLPEGGVLRIPQATNDGSIGEFFVGRARLITEEYLPALSARQEAAIDAQSERDWTRLRNSDHAAAVLADHLATADPGPLAHRKIGRNERCPCGSGSKYKRCHGR